MAAQREPFRRGDADVAVHAAQALRAAGVGEERPARIGHHDRAGAGGDALGAVDPLQHDEAGAGGDVDRGRDVAEVEVARRRDDRHGRRSHVMDAHVAGRGGDRQGGARRHLQEQPRPPRHRGLRQRTPVVPDRQRGGGAVPFHRDPAAVEPLEAHGHPADDDGRVQAALSEHLDREVRGIDLDRLDPGQLDAPLDRASLQEPPAGGHARAKDQHDGRDPTGSGAHALL